MSTRRRRACVSAAFEYWRREGFPYYALTATQIHAEYRRLEQQDPDSAFTGQGALGSVVGLRLANFFQPTMWSVRVSRYRCPMDVFIDDDLLRLAIERSWTIWPDRRGANGSTLRRMLKTFPNTAAVSNFRPTLARAVVARFSREGDTVVDFSAGFGGRLLGAMTLPRRYIGIEPCREQATGLRQNIKAVSCLKPAGASAKIIVGPAEAKLASIASGSTQLVFSSPPYYDWERYSMERSQSYLRYTSYSAWLAGFLEPVIAESYRILSGGGRMVLNVSGRERRPTREDVVRIACSCGFTIEREIPMLLARVPYLHPRNLGPYKPELLLVFTKNSATSRIA